MKYLNRNLLNKPLLLVFTFSAFLLLLSCGQEKPKPFISYYYWKSNFALDSVERKAVDKDNVQQLYVRYFDVVYDALTKAAKPIAPISLKREDLIKPIVPVVFIKNQIFEQLDSAAVLRLADDVLALMEQINKAAGIKCRAVQFDCDWTEGTQPKYFFFLKKMREKIDAHENHSSFASMTMLTATIRLHQVKFFEKTGVPPVDKGVLMFYNMGEIGTGEQNSIYDQALSKTYLPWLHKYTLRLDIALPIFSWGIHIRNGQILNLLNKMDQRDFSDSLLFESLRTNRYRAKSSFFNNGFYFEAGDEVKVEQIEASALEQLLSDLKQYYPNQFQQIIFYDLDRLNLSRYEQDFAQKIIDRY